MKYFEFSELFFFILSSSVFGIIGGVLYETARISVGFVRRFFYLPKILLTHNSEISFKKSRELAQIGGNRAVLNFSVQLTDFLFFISLGCAYLLLVYITLDGVILWYGALLGILSFLFIGKGVGRLISEAAEKLLSSIFVFILTLLLFAVMPFKKVIIAVVTPIIKAIKSAYFSLVEGLFVRKRLLDAKMIFKLCAKRINKL